METIVVWFRRDLRLHGNQTLYKAASDAEGIVPVYCFDPAEYGKREFGGRKSFRFEKTGAHRTQFRIEAVEELRKQVRDHDGELIVRVERPSKCLPRVVEEVDADAVYCQRLPTPEEQTIRKTVSERVDVPVETFWTHTLHHVDDLPVYPGRIEDTFTQWRKTVEAEERVRDPLPQPNISYARSVTDVGNIPDVTDLGVPEPPESERAVIQFTGGESAGRDRVQEYIWERDSLREYKEKRNEMLGTDYSSKFSPWLSEGCISPRWVYEEVQQYEDERVENDSTYWLVFELRWRDFFQFQFLKHGGQFFTREGIRERTDIDWRTDQEAFRRWAHGETGIPFVDANMRELNLTGYMSNRGRQIAASFLCNNLRLDWRWGAAYYETQLLDYDPCSNYGNWAYIAGVGNDSRDRHFNIIKQAEKYDPNADYVQTWCPELSGLPAEMAHEPWKMNDGLQAMYDAKLGEVYPEPMINLEESYEKLH